MFLISIFMFFVLPSFIKGRKLPGLDGHNGNAILNLNEALRFKKKGSPAWAKPLNNHFVSLPGHLRVVGRLQRTEQEHPNQTLT